jgi:hypothetical protein
MEGRNERKAFTRIGRFHRIQSLFQIFADHEHRIGIDNYQIPQCRPAIAFEQKDSIESATASAKIPFFYPKMAGLPKLQLSREIKNDSARSAYPPGDAL